MAVTTSRMRTWPLAAAITVAAAVALSACTGSPESAPTASVVAPTAAATPSATSATSATSGAQRGGGAASVTPSRSGGASTATGEESPDELGGTGLDPITPTVPGPAEASLAALLPGMYGLAGLGGEIHGRTATISTSGRCDFVLDVLAAGQWNLEIFAEPRPGTDPTLDSHTYAAIMSMGDRVALLSLDDSAYACTGSIVTERSARISITGAATVSGNAAFLPLNCQPDNNSDSDTPASHSVVGIYRTAEASYLLMAGLPAAKGTHHLDPDADQVIMLAALGPGDLAQFSKLLAVFYDPLGAVNRGEDPSELMSQLHGWTSQVDDQADSTAEVTVTSTLPYVGTLSAKKLADPDAPSSTIAVTLGFTCDT